MPPSKTESSTLELELYTHEKLLEVPLGQIDPHATTVITVGWTSLTSINTPSTDSDPGVGISDGTNMNLMMIVNADNCAVTPPFSPCYPKAGVHLEIDPGGAK